VTASANDCIHLSIEIVREIHRAVIAEVGGTDGVRDPGLLESAVAAPQASFGGESPFADLIEVAAAYLFYLCRNHPFLDGNKRVAITAAIVFLRLNGIEPAADSEAWARLLMEVSSSKLDRPQTTERLRALIPAVKGS
jgi:death on curing protein